MTLLNQYVKAVRMYLPKGPQQEDILSELSEHLQSRIDEEEDALGRPLTEVEQEALLSQHGNPERFPGLAIDWAGAVPAHSRGRTGTGCRPSLVSSLTVRRWCCSIHLR
jgi:hypothetical protein